MMKNILKAEGKHHSLSRGETKGRMITDFLWKAMQATRWWIDIFKVLKEKKKKICQARIQKQTNKKSFKKEG